MRVAHPPAGPLRADGQPLPMEGGVDRGDPCPALTFPSEALPPPALRGESARGNPVIPVSGNGTGRKCLGEVPGEEEAGLRRGAPGVAGTSAPLGKGGPWARMKA